MLAERVGDARDEESKADDAALVARVLSGDTDAYAALVRRHVSAAFATARVLTTTEEDAEDACQDAFARAYFRLRECREPDHFRGWLLQIVRHRAHNLRAYQALRACVSLDAAPASAKASQTGGSDRGVELDELRDALERAMASLSDIKRRVVAHYEVDGWTHEQVALQLGISVLMSRRHLSDARRQLRRALSAFAPFDEVSDDE